MLVSSFVQLVQRVEVVGILFDFAMSSGLWMQMIGKMHRQMNSGASPVQRGSHRWGLFLFRITLARRLLLLYFQPPSLNIDPGPSCQFNKSADRPGVGGLCPTNGIVSIMSSTRRMCDCKYACVPGCVLHFISVQYRVSDSLMETETEFLPQLSKAPPKVVLQTSAPHHFISTAAGIWLFIARLVLISQNIFFCK